LAQLEREPNGLRLGELSQRMMVTNGNVTGLVDKLVEHGFVVREPSAEDRRAPEVEAALLTHPDVLECGVIGAADDERGQIVEAHVVLKPGVAGDAACAKRLQDHVKATIAPYKYPRSVKFRSALPKTATGKIQRFKLSDI